MTVQQWTRTELSFTSADPHEHPDTEVRLAAVFTAPSGATVRMPGFWDGDDRWCIRFAPTEMGRWTWATESNDSGLDAQSGEIEAVPYEGDLDVYRHGFVRVSDDRRRFVHDDGTPFFWLGNTHWQAPNYERLHECNNPHDPECTSQFRCSADNDRARGFTVYQTYPDAALNDGGGNVSEVNWWTEDYVHLNPQAFRDQFDVMMDYLADHGTVIALGMGVHTETGRIGAEALSHFTQHVTARYAAHPVVWITGQEVDIENEHSGIGPWLAAAETIAANDGYRHPLGAHMWSIGEPTAFADEPWHDWFPTQGGHEGVRTQEHYRFYWDYQPTKPFLETEANYEDIWDVTTTATRQAAWKALQCGSYGYTYGVAGIWAMKWDYDVPGWDDFQNGIPWFDGLDRPGGRQMTHLKDFYVHLDWARLVPRFGDEAYGTFVDPEKSVLSSDDAGTTVVYLYSRSTAVGTLRGLDAEATYTARWFDPREGSYLDVASVTPADGEWAIPSKPSAEDWVLLVTRD
jgi:hypothetical protein